MTIKQSIVAPSENPNDELVLLGKLQISHLSEVKAGDVICEIETSKAVVDIECEESGFIEWLFEEGDEVAVGICFANIHDSSSSIPEKGEKDKTSSSDSDDLQFTKKAKKLFDDSNLSLDDFAGFSFVTEKDILIKTSASSNSNPAKDNATTLPENTKQEKVSFQKRQEIRALSGGQNVLTSNFAVKVQLPKEFFEQTKSNSFNNLKNNLTPNILIKTCALLKEYPEFNAFFDNDNIYYHNSTEIGYALDLGKGLKVVNLGDISTKSAEEVNKILYAFFINYTRNKLSVKELSGSTFSITDVSGESVLEFSPLINRFQSAILGISSPHEIDKCFILNLVFDHRVTEGKKAAAFLNELKTEIETIHATK